MWEVNIIAYVASKKWQHRQSVEPEVLINKTESCRDEQNNYSDPFMVKETKKYTRLGYDNRPDNVSN